MVDPYVTLARQAVEHYVRNGTLLPLADNLVSAEMRRAAGVFVSLHRADGELRGCVGSFQPITENIATEIIRNAAQAATRDPRFPPVDSTELDHLVYSVDVLSTPEEVSSRRELDPARYGVLVRRGPYIGLLLPDLSGVDTVADQINIACRKAGLDPDDPQLKLFRFSVERHGSKH